MIILTLFVSAEVKANEVRHVSVPYYENLSIKEMSLFVEKGNMHVFDYLPDKQEIHKISREWICNIFASVLKNIFTEWVRAKIEERNIEMIEKKELNIELDADVADCFN